MTEIYRCACGYTSCDYRKFMDHNCSEYRKKIRKNDRILELMDENKKLKEKIKELEGE